MLDQKIGGRTQRRVGRHAGITVRTAALQRERDVSSGEKHLLGLVRGSSENAAVVKDLLQSLVKRGIDASVDRHGLNPLVVFEDLGIQLW